MRSEYILIGLILLTLACITALLSAAVYFLAPSGETQPTSRVTTTKTVTTTEKTTKPQSNATSTTSSSQPTTTTQTTTTLEAVEETGELEINTTAKKYYKNDDLTVLVTSRGERVEEATVTVDGTEQQATNSQGEATFYALEGGEHEIKAEKNGYNTSHATINVSIYSYPYSEDVRIQRTPAERRSLIDQGKVVFRFYDSPSCAYCRIMKPWAAEIVNRNRECIAYELLVLYYDGPREEVRELFEDEESVSTPVIVIEGLGGRYVSSGPLSKTELEDMIFEASSQRCVIR